MPTVVVSTIIPGGGGDFTSLVDWELARRGDITAGGSDTIEIAEVHPGGDVGPVEILQANGWVTDFTNYIVIRGPSGTFLNGDFSDTTNNPYATAGANDFVIDSDTHVVEIHGLFLDGGMDPGGNVRFGSFSFGEETAFLVSRCMLRTSGADNVRFNKSHSQSRSHVVTNCFMINNNAGAGSNVIISSTVDLFDNTTAFAINNTCFKNASTGNFAAVGTGAHLYTRNNYCYNGIENVYGNANSPGGADINAIGTGKNASLSDASNATTHIGPFVPGPENANLLSIPYDTTNFLSVTPGAENYSLVVTSSLFDSVEADDLTGPFTAQTGRDTRSNWVQGVLDDTYTVGNTKDVFLEDLFGKTRLAPRDIGAAELLFLNPDFIADTTAGIGTLDVQFTDTTPNGPAGTYDWDFGDTNTSTLQNPPHTYDTPGTYTVTLVIDQGLGTENTETKINFITVAPYTVDFSASDTTIPQLQDVTFTNLTNGSPTTFDWDFGDGQTSNDENPVIQYSTVGTFTVTLTVDLGLPSEETLVKTDYMTITDGIPPFTVITPAGGTFIDAVVVDLVAYTDDTLTTEEP